MKFHHIGLVVPHIESSLGELSRYLPFEEQSLPSEVGSQKVRVCFLDMGKGLLELIEPLDETSPVAGFAAKGGGIHHICFEVANIYAAIAELESKGAVVIVKPVVGFENRLIAFVYLNMKHTDCNLIELAEEISR